jgi:hypothetical protein
MDRSFTILHALVLLCVIIPTSVYSRNSYFRYTNSEYRFSVALPKNWHRRKINLWYKHLYILNRDRYTEIRITATVPDLKELDKWESWQEWYTSGIGGKIRQITETREVVIDETIIGRMLLFDYTENRRRILQRVLIVKFNNSLVTIECKAPVTTFDRYKNTFDQIMASIKKTD